MSRKGGLGRGFESLIPTDVLDEAFDPTAKTDEKVSELRHLKVALLAPNPDQPRRHFDEAALDELAASIREHGVVQPLVVVAVEKGYRIVAGERRWRAAQIAGLDEVPAIVRTLSNQHQLEIALIENLQRKDLNPLETATAYLKLHTQFNMSYEDIGQRVGGKATSTISNILRLLRLPAPAKQALVEGHITEGHARQILAIEDAEVQQELLDYIVKEGWSVRKAEQYVLGYKKGGKAQAPESRETAVKHTRSETPLTQALGKRLEMPVMLKTMAHGGQIIISFKNEDDLKRIEQLLR